MRIAAALIALALTLPTAASAADRAGILPFTPAALKTAIQSSLPGYKPVYKKTLDSKKFAGFLASPANYERLTLFGRRPGGPRVEGGMFAYVATKVYPNKVFVQTVYMGKQTWVKGNRPM